MRGFVTAGLVMCAVACTDHDGTPAIMASASPMGAAIHLEVPAAPTGLARYERIVRNVEGCALEGYQVAPACPGMATFRAGMANVPGDIQAAVGRALLASASPAVRISAAELLREPAGVSAGSLDALAAAARRERDPGVLRAFVRVIAGSTTAHAPASAVLLAAAGHPDRDVRLQAVEALTSPAHRGIAGAAGTLAALAERDSDARVRQAACESAGKLGSDELLPLYEKLTAPGTDADLYAACMEGLVRMFHDHPTFATANEKAYRLFLRRLDDKPRTEHSPPWTVTSTFCYYSHDSDPDRLAAWKRRAPWFDVAEVKRAMAGVIADKHASWMARAAAVESLVGLGATTAELAALRRGYDAADRADKPVLDKIAAVLTQ